MNKNKKGLSENKIEKVAGGKEDISVNIETYGGEEFLNDVPCHIDSGATKRGCMVGWNNGDSNSLNFSHNAEVLSSDS